MSQINIQERLLYYINSCGNYCDVWIKHFNESIAKNEAWKSIAKGYFEYEAKLISESKFISNIYLFPSITMEIINKFKKENNGIIPIDYKLEVSIFSTMLPRHFYNFPHKIEVPLENNSCKNKVLLYTEDYVEKYRTDMIKIIMNNSHNHDIRVNRYTLLAYNEVIAGKLIKSDPLYYTNNIFTLDDFLDDYMIMPMNKMKIKNVRKKSDCELSCGLTQIELNELDKINYIYEEHELTYFKKLKGKYPFNNLLCSFISDLHSTKSGYILIISDDNSIPSDEKLNVILSKNIEEENIIHHTYLERINPDFIKFEIIPKKDNGSTANNNSYKFYLSAKINLESNTVELRVLHEENSNKEMYHKYDELYNILFTKALPLNSDLGFERNLRDYVKEELGGVDDEDYIEFYKKYKKYESDKNLQELIDRFISNNTFEMDATKFRKFIKNI